MGADGSYQHNTAEVGAAVVGMDHANSSYGEYSGIGDDDAYLVGNLEGLSEQGAYYYRLQTNDLGLDSRRLDLSAGKHGSYALEFIHDEIPHLISSDARTPFEGAGGTRLVLPAGFVQSTTTSGMTALEDSLKTLDLRTDRTRNQFRVTEDFARGWRASLSVRREDKEGVQSLGGLTAQNAGLADTTILPQPVDYRTEEFSVGLEYAGDDRQMEVGYLLSVFHDNNASIIWDVPFLKANPTALDYPAVARIGLPPDNTYQRLTVSGGMILPGSTRVSGIVEAGQMRQDDAFLPYSTDDIGGTASVLEDGDALPRESAEARIDVLHLALNLASHPLSALGVTARYRYYGTDNKTPYTLFDRVMNDTVPQSTTDDIYSRPYDRARSTFEVGAGYRVAAGFNLKADYKHEDTNYDRHRPVRGTAENTLKAGVNGNFGDVSGRVGYVHAQRDAEDYDGFLSYSTLFDSLSCPSIVTVDPDPDTGGSTQVDTCFRNHPDFRQFDLASRERNRYYASVIYAPDEKVQIGLDVADSRETFRDNILFDDTYLGLTSDDGMTATLDVGYTPEDSWSVSAYVTRELMDSSQTGRAFGGAASTAIDSSLNWTADFDDEITTVGIQGGFDMLHEMLHVTMDYAYTKAKSRIRFTAGSGVTYEDMPEDGSERHAASLRAVYRVSDSIAYAVGFGYERFRSQDWALDSVEAGGTALNDVLLLSGPQEDYRVYLGSVSVIYSW